MEHMYFTITKYFTCKHVLEDFNFYNHACKNKNDFLFLITLKFEDDIDTCVNWEHHEKFQEKFCRT